MGDLVMDGDGDLIVHVRQGKGRKDRMVPLNRETSALVSTYLTQRGIRIGIPASSRSFFSHRESVRGMGV